jgi:hypothetical protein
LCVCVCARARSCACVCVSLSHECILAPFPFLNHFLPQAHVVRRVVSRGPPPQFIDSFGEEPSVDCWVYVEQTSKTLRACFLEFERRGGKVAWDALENMLAAPESARDEVHSNRSRRSKLGKNASQEHHLPCSTLFDNSTATLVETQHSPIYSMFR